MGILQKIKNPFKKNLDRIIIGSDITSGISLPDFRGIESYLRNISKKTPKEIYITGSSKSNEWDVQIKY